MSEPEPLFEPIYEAIEQLRNKLGYTLKAFSELGGMKENYLHVFNSRIKEGKDPSVNIGFLDTLVEKLEEAKAGTGENVLPEDKKQAIDNFIKSLGEALTPPEGLFQEMEKAAKKVSTLMRYTGYSRAEVKELAKVSYHYFDSTDNRSALPNIKVIDALVQGLENQTVPAYRRAAYDATVSGFAASMVDAILPSSPDFATAESFFHRLELLAQSAGIPKEELHLIARTHLINIYNALEQTGAIDQEKQAAAQRNLAAYAEAIPEYRRQAYLDANEAFWQALTQEAPRQSQLPDQHGQSEHSR